MYRTVDRRGRSIRASGLFAYPTSGPHRLRQVLFEHGTTPSSADAPSVGKGDTYQQAGALSFAAAGYAVAAPDYVGLGVGQGYPAYLDGRTEVSASVDLLDAARDFAAGKDLRLSRGVRVAGFSQGAHAALVTARDTPARTGAASPPGRGRIDQRGLRLQARGAAGDPQR